ncbi:MAG: succinate dehydrogenase, cytochrome b556 subunit [Candidatus Puniceispirillum sp.]|nr:succinate dehydrogenase, cytochrome b556 subunit [Candidatus Pelagibacter sp.]MBA4283691.1 succinate dehydrogenase, cytochrome b556 subunit [Candidatus Puniceispirillum sp.]
MKQRPLSPHLQIYKPQWSSVISILHRMTGVYLFINLIFASIYLFLLTCPTHIFETFVSIVRCTPYYFLIYTFLWSLIFHSLNGIKYFFWAKSKFMEKKYINALGPTILLLSILCTTFIILY